MTVPRSPLWLACPKSINSLTVISYPSQRLGSLCCKETLKYSYQSRVFFERQTQQEIDVQQDRCRKADRGRKAEVLIVRDQLPHLRGWESQTLRCVLVSKKMLVQALSTLKGHQAKRANAEPEVGRLRNCLTLWSPACWVTLTYIWKSNLLYWSLMIWRFISS